MGKKKRNRKHYAPIFNHVTALPEWRRLPRSAKLLYIYIKQGHNGTNNGQITLPYSRLKDEFSTATFSTAVKALVKEGWIERSEHGGLHRKATKYKLTLKYDEVFKVG